VLLRYFNPVGAHVSGTIGEDPAGIPSNLMPFIQRVAAGRLPQLTVYGDDWDTPDGACVGDARAGAVLAGARALCAPPPQRGGVAVCCLGPARTAMQRRPPLPRHSRTPHISPTHPPARARAGTALRDYIHVVDLARGHLAAVDWLFKRAAEAAAAASATTAVAATAAAGGGAAAASDAGAGVGGAALCEVFNLGTGRPSSVKEVIAAYEAAAGGRPLPHTFGPRRPGDVQGSWADASKAASVLGWTAGKTLPDMCADSWRWASANPQGYGGSA
jgi:UDP-glucose 4-epimerase